uniref:Uncharacterized protein n=1 Tax=Avena sativa TaxID=4498 RepID=A0ACD5U4Y8_AVESA
MYYCYMVLAWFFCYNLVSKAGDAVDVCGHHKNLLYYCDPRRLRKINGCDLIYCEIQRSIEKRMTPNFCHESKQKQVDRARYSLARSFSIRSTAMAPRALLLLAVGLMIVAAASAHGGYGSCPSDALKVKACVDVLGLLKVKVGVPPHEPCCSLLNGLVGLDAAACLCTNIHANVLGLNLNLPVDLRLILNNCGKVCPDDFQCLPHHH